MRFSGRFSGRSADERSRGEQGFVLAVTALMMVPLLVFTAFAVDLGAWYGQGAKMQRAADAASLAGVVQLPSKVNAIAAVQASLAKNGFPYTCVAAPATGPCVISYPTGAGQQLNVALTTSATQYFSKIVMSSEVLHRDATSVYNLKIPLGSPSNVFGNDPTRAGAQPNLWGAINGPYSNHADGDAYSTHCGANNGGSATSCAGNTVNPTYRDTGFIWAVEVVAQASYSPVTVAIYDPSFGPNSTLNEGYSGGSTGFATSFEVFNATSSAAYNLSNANSLKTLGRCSPVSGGYKVFPSGDTTGQNAWYTLCTFTPTGPGIYPVQVKTSAIPTVTDSGTGFNAYSLRAVASAGTQPKLYALDDLSIWTPTPGSTAKFYLAEIGQQYAGHTLQIDLYDPGDGTAGSSPFTMQFLAPPAGVPSIVPTSGSTVNCDYNLTAAGYPTLDTNSGNCTIKTLNANSSSGIYNNGWLRVQIAIPVSYTCTTDCWWSVKYSFGSGSTPTDRTVWVVNVLGDPVHLTS